jgi:hypothetical protein
MQKNALRSMQRVAVACITKPGHPSIWYDAERRYVCPDEPEVYARAEQSQAAIHDAQSSPRLDPKFKLVFLTTAGGTLLFTVVCVALHLAATGEPPPARKEFIEGMLTMVKIGFGAIVGLLGGKVT